MVVINKPYGIPIFNDFKNHKNLSVRQTHKIVGAVDYSIETVLPYIAKELDIPNLIPCIGAEKYIKKKFFFTNKFRYKLIFLFDRYMTGVYVFAINEDIAKQIIHARTIATHFRKFRKYWGITIRVPNEIKGSYRLAMKLETFRSKSKKVDFTSAYKYFI